MHNIIFVSFLRLPYWSLPYQVSCHAAQKWLIGVQRKLGNLVCGVRITLESTMHWIIFSVENIQEVRHHCTILNDVQGLQYLWVEGWVLISTRRSTAVSNRSLFSMDSNITGTNATMSEMVVPNWTQLINPRRACNHKTRQSNLFGCWDYPAGHGPWKYCCCKLIVTSANTSTS